MRRLLAVVLLTFCALVSTGSLTAQCAMCREAAAAQRQEAAEAFNHAILVLGAPPVFILAGIGIALWRRRTGPDSTPPTAGLQ